MREAPHSGALEAGEHGGMLPISFYHAHWNALATVTINVACY
jgi:hypothetical protein